ncbi:unnamed protein product [Mytilus coruscus]|uniref:Reverse transcriptase domain-containing protein n=1 Tax=Mytilus coruscus TaxID=42192 RepID=A0A6J8DD40_MYTCO|nr:unnamed protein product [Mytilus coruscus]
MRGAMYGVPYFQTLLKQSDICFLTEHWLNETNVCFLHNIIDEFHVVYSISSSCMNSSRGSGETAKLIRKSSGFRIKTLEIQNDRICGVILSIDGFQGNVNVRREEKYEDIKNAAEVDIGEFFRTARKMRKQGPATDKIAYDDIEAKTPEDILNGAQTLLNVVNSYALKWRLKYNASKSSVMTFTPPRKTRNNNDSAACLNLGNVLERKGTCTYAGTFINSDGKTFDRSDSSSKKLKQKLHSLYTVRVKPRGMSASTNNLIRKRIILTTALYACETLGQLHLYSTVKLKC